MRVLVTGASGFLGGHITAALVAAGHGVRAFVRSPDKLARALAPLDTAVDEVATGDVTDGAAVRAALDGCDAVIHTANVYTLDPRRTAEMTRTNVTGTEVVLAAAVEAGCDPVVHVSTAQTFWPWPSSIDGDPPLAPLEGMPYSDSKKRAEAIARSWQDRGAPVVTTYPGGTLGPHDPGPGEQLQILRALLLPTAPMRIAGGFPICDVDWVSRVHAGLVVPGQGPRRVTCTGRYLRWAELFDLARRVTGRSLPNPLPMPRWLSMVMGGAMDGLQRVVPMRLPFGRESAWVLFSAVDSTDATAIHLAGARPPVDETFARAARWACEAGHLTRRQAGALAPA